MALGYFVLLPETELPGPQITETCARKFATHLGQNLPVPREIQVMDPDVTEGSQLFLPDRLVVFEEFDIVWLPDQPDVPRLWASFVAQNPIYRNAILERDRKIRATPIEQKGPFRPDAARRSQKKDAQEVDVLWHVRMVMDEPLWPTGTGSGVKVAVLDSGVDLNNPLLMDGFLEGVSFTGTSNCMDDNGHGTHVTGIIAARPGVSATGTPLHWSIAPGCSHYSVKVLASDAYGECAWLLAGLKWVKKRDAHVVNMSFEDPSELPESIHKVIKQMASKVVFVASVGNRGKLPDSVCWPAKYRQVIGVGAVDSDRVIWDSSSLAPDDQSLPEENVDMVAPGAGVVSSVLGSATINEMSGTSMAAGVLSGICALLREKDPALAGTASFRARLKPSLVDLGRVGADAEYGRGLARFEG